MARRIYWVLLIATVITGIIFYFYREDIIEESLFVILLILSITFVASIHGIIAHTLNPSLKGGLIAYPVFMGILFSILFFLYIFLITPMFFPNFLGGLKY